MSLGPATAWRAAQDTPMRVNDVQRLAWQDDSRVTASLHSPTLVDAPRHSDDAFARADDSGPYGYPDDRRRLALAYVWRGDIDEAVSVACDLLGTPAPAGFRALLDALIRLGSLRSAAGEAKLRLPQPLLLPTALATPQLSAREAAVLRLISKGQSNKSIARELHIAPETVKSHAKKIFFKLSARTRAQAVARALALGML